MAAAVWAWPKQLPEVSWSEANRKFVILHSWNTTHAGNVFGLASMMLVAGGESSYSTSNGCYSNCEVWYPEYATAQQLGAPVASYTQLPNGVYVRRYQNGIVLVNATAGPVPTFPLGGTYSGSGLTNVSRISMGPASGDVLLATAPAKSTGGGTNGGSGGVSLRKLIRTHPLNR